MSQALHKSFFCHICPKVFTRKFNLQNHLYSHTKTRPYQCEVCHVSFVRDSDRKIHERKHNSFVDEYFCESCRKSFTKLASVQRHQRSQSRRDCDGICKRGFRNGTFTSGAVEYSPRIVRYISPKLYEDPGAPPPAPPPISRSTSPEDKNGRLGRFALSSSTSSYSSSIPEDRELSPERQPQIRVHPYNSHMPRSDGDPTTLENGQASSSAASASIQPQHNFNRDILSLFKLSEIQPTIPVWRRQATSSTDLGEQQPPGHLLANYRVSQVPHQPSTSENSLAHLDWRQRLPTEILQRPPNHLNGQFFIPRQLAGNKASHIDIRIDGTQPTIEELFPEIFGTTIDTGIPDRLRASSPQSRYTLSSAEMDLVLRNGL